MKAYIDIIKKIFDKGEFKKNRTAVYTYSVPGMMFEHDMSDGFPLLTTKFVPFRLIASELEFFIKGITDKQWLKDRKNHIWDEWCNPTIVPYSADDPKIQAEMAAENDLGPIYGWQWRHFGEIESHDPHYFREGVDQLANVIERIKTEPNCRRMIVSAWNPVDFHKMALPPCHYSFQILVNNGKLNLLWNQRSVDVGLGLPFNIASYALLLHLIAKETGYEEGRLIGFLADTHIYVNHIDALTDQISRELRPLPQLITNNFKSIFDWEYTDTIVDGYNPQGKIKLDIAI